MRILKDLDRDINHRDVLIVEDVVDSGLTLSWLLRNPTTRHPRSLRVCTLLRKPDAVGANADIAYVGFDISNEFVLGYGLHYDERFTRCRDFAKALTERVTGASRSDRKTEAAVTVVPPVAVPPKTTPVPANPPVG